MIFSRRFWFILLRVVLIVSLALGLTYTVFETDLLVTPAMFGLLVLIATIELTWTVQKQERTWARFLQSVKYQDFNRAYQKQSSKELDEAYELITHSMEDLQSGKQAEFRLLQTVLGHIPVGVACYNEEGKIAFTNTAFEELLGLKALVHINKLKKDYPEVYQAMADPGSFSTEWIDHKRSKKLLVRTERFELKGERLNLISLTDIRSSLDAKEIESYQKLMRVMTHEIMNSATPILSLIRVVNKKLIEDEELKLLEKKDQKNIAKSLQAVEERTAGILKFVEAYKKINKNIQLNRGSVESKELLEEVQALMGHDTPNVTLKFKDQLNDTLLIDRKLISQVLINLIKNAQEALYAREDGEIIVTLRDSDGTAVIEVCDNGPGVRSENIHQIFVPFFSTKPEGSGIGLALSRKIVRAHGGTLELISQRIGSRFRITLLQA